MKKEDIKIGMKVWYNCYEWEVMFRSDYYTRLERTEKINKAVTKIYCVADINDLLFKEREKIGGSTWSAIQKDCENADCGKCERCIDEMDDPIVCLSKEEICFSTSILIIIFIILIIIIL